MSQIFDFLFQQYYNSPKLDVILEIIAVIFGFLSVWFSKKNNVLVFPTGIISTIIFVYLLYKWELIGDMMINGYYFSMSIYGWYLWTRTKNGEPLNPISKTTSIEKKQCLFIFIGTLGVVYAIYQLFDKWTSWTAYIDTITTAIFFVGMWLMAKRKIEHWIFWITGDIISVPLYFYKGFTFTSFQYFIFTFIAIFGYLEWKKYLNKKNQELLK